MKLWEDIHKTTVPVPYPLKTVNCYLINSKDGWSLIDTGCNTKETRDFWLETFSEKGVIKGSLTDVYITHFHPDHMGLAGWLQQEYGARVHMTRLDKEWMDFEWGNLSDFAYLLKQLYIRNGCPYNLAERIKDASIKQQNDVFPLPEKVEEIEVGSKIKLGTTSYKILSLPGHCDSMIALWDEINKVLISSDSILPHITPNVGVWPKMKPNPLKRFLNSLNKIIDLDPVITLPGHGEVMKDATNRAKYIISHHKKRLTEMNHLIADGHNNAFEIANKYFNLKKLDSHQIRFALAETLAHIDYLVGEEKVLREDKDKIEVSLVSV